jgi:hypothetical protein
MKACYESLVFHVKLRNSATESRRSSGQRSKPLFHVKQSQHRRIDFQLSCQYVQFSC